VPDLSLHRFFGVWAPILLSRQLPLVSEHDGHDVISCIQSGLVAYGHACIELASTFEHVAHDQASVAASSANRSPAVRAAVHCSKARVRHCEALKVSSSRRRIMLLLGRATLPLLRRHRLSPGTQRESIYSQFAVGRR
jgi:hypothetical protein